MTSYTISYWADTLGMLSGVVGISIAIYLQWIMEERCPIKYVLAFASIGIALMLITVRAVLRIPGPPHLKTIGYIIVMGVEIWGFRVVHLQVRNQPITEALKEHLKDGPQ